MSRSNIRPVYRTVQYTGTVYLYTYMYRYTGSYVQLYRYRYRSTGIAASTVPVGSYIDICVPKPLPKEYILDTKGVYNLALDGTRGAFCKFTH